MALLSFCLPASLFLPKNAPVPHCIVGICILHHGCHKQLKLQNVNCANEGLM